MTSRKALALVSGSLQEITGDDYIDPAILQGYDIDALNRITGAIAETMPRVPLSNTSYLLTGRESATRIIVPPQKTISAVTFASASTALATATHQYAVFRNSALGKLAVTVDDVANAWAGSVMKTLYFARTVTDLSITSGQNVATSPTAAWTAADVGKQIIVVGAGASAATLGAAPTLDNSGVANTNPSVTVSSVGLDGVNTARLSANAGTTVTNATAYIATPYVTTNTAYAAFYLDLMVAATTVPTMLGIIPTVTGVTFQLPPVLGSVDTTHTGLTTPATSPTTGAHGTAGTGMGMAWAYLS